MTKADLLALLEGIKQATLLGYILYEHAERTGIDGISVGCINSHAWTIKAHSGAHTVDLRPLGVLLSDTTGERAIVRSNYLLLLDFSMLRTTHEVIVEYCNATRQLPAYQASGDLYRIARVARNLVSHGDGGTLTEWPSNFKKQGILTVTWEDITLSHADLAQPVYVDTRQTFRLHDALREFVRAALS